MNTLFLNFENLSEVGGITKKILFQKEAMEKNGLNVSFSHIEKDREGNVRLIIDNSIITSYGSGLWGKIGRYARIKDLYQWIMTYEIKFIYVRYTRFANPFYTNLFKKLKRHGIIIFMEIPTYPYDGEYLGKGKISSLMRVIEKYYRKKLARHIDRIVTFSNDNEIWGVKTIRILNGVNIETIPLKEQNHGKGIVLVGVASMLFWHGYDRIISGMKKYYASTPAIKVYLNLVGGNDNNPNYLSLKKMVKDLELDKYVKFHGELLGEKLDEVFNISDIACGSLGRHRTGVYRFQSLKNVEYAVRGIPFIYSEISPLFDKEKYILHCPPDESPINIDSIVAFYDSLSLSPMDIRKNCVSKKVSWEDQFRIITDELYQIRIFK